MTVITVAMAKCCFFHDVNCWVVLQVKPYPVQANYAAIISLGANTVQPGEVQGPHHLTQFLDIVSTSPLSVIEAFILHDASVIHQKGARDI